MPFRPLVRPLAALRTLLPEALARRHPVVPVVRLSGAIGAVSPLRAGLSLGACAPALERAFGMKGIRAVALVINSPGGSAAQSHLIFRRIRALAAEAGVPVLAFVEDVAASGGYMIACAADEIHCDPSSLVGSIGVVSAGFGFTGLIERLGVERRIHTAGKAKAMLDPFRPENPDDVARLKAIQADVQAMFTELVQSRRPGLKGDPDDLFSGAVWTGRQGLALGLVDGHGDVRSVLRARFGDTVKLPVIEQVRGGLLARLLRRREPGAVGLAAVEGALAILDERAAFARYGL